MNWYVHQSLVINAAADLQKQSQILSDIVGISFSIPGNTNTNRREPPIMVPILRSYPAFTALAAISVYLIICMPHTSTPSTGS